MDDDVSLDISSDFSSLISQEDEADLILTPEQTVEKAISIAEMSDRLISYQQRNDFCKYAMQLIKPYLEEIDGAKAAYAKVRRKMYAARARARIELYEKACAARDSAKTAGDYEYAAKQFERVPAYDKKHILRQKFMEKDLWNEAGKCSDAKEQADQCWARMKKLDCRASVKKWLIAAVVAVLVALLFLFSRTTVFLKVKGTVASLIGAHDKAWVAWDSYWEKTKDPAAEENRDREKYKAAMAEILTDDDGTVKKGYDEYRDLAMAGYSDSAATLVEYEKSNIEAAEIGETVNFINTDWIVLEKKSGKALLVRRASMKEVAGLSGGTNWSDSGLRDYLNGAFIENKFLPEEQKMLLKTKITPVYSPAQHGLAGVTTEDRLFLLSREEYIHYQEYFPSSTTCWFLRTPGEAEGALAFVYADGSVMGQGYDIRSAEIRLRPAMWLRYKSS